jgi:Na+-transporting NADH:ubiquinone oxidoreductase subunit NqrB
MRFPWWFLFDQSWQRHVIGVVGFAVLLGVLFQWLRHEQDSRRQEQWYWEQLVWSLVSVVLILVHTNFRFGNMIARLAFVFLMALVGSNAVIAILHHTFPHATSAGAVRPIPSSSQSENPLLQRLFTLHALLLSGCLVFSAIHILAILYY